MTESFSRQMRIVTRKKHKISDALVNAKLVFALSDSAVWLDGLLCFHPIFDYLEQNIPADQLSPAVYRAAAIEHDIRHYCAQLGLDADQKLAERRPSVAKYLRHLQTVAAENPQLLLAYAYHLYMGMLSGGQILNRKRRMFASPRADTVDADAGYRTTMYDEVGGPTMGELKTTMRRTVDELGDRVDEATRQRLLDESIMVFELNNGMIHSIRGGGRVALRKLGLAVGVVLCAVIFYKVLRAGYV